MVLMLGPAAYADNSNGIAELMQQLGQAPDTQDVKNAEIDVEYDAAKCAAYYDFESASARRSGYGD